MDTENNTRKVLVVGHKNPDTDSICSAIAYAQFKNRITGTNIHVPARAGEINPETRYVLDLFKQPVPEYVASVSAQVMDMEIRKTPGLSADTTIKEAWNFMNEYEAVTQPVTEDGHIIGLVTKGNIAQTLMSIQTELFLSSASPCFGGIAQALNGKITAGDGNDLFNKGRVRIAAATVDTMLDTLTDNDLVILADRKENQIAALNNNASCLVLCLGATADSEVLSLAAEKNAVIIETEYDTLSAGLEIYKSIPLSSIMVTDDLTVFKLTDFIDDVSATMREKRHRAFPVVDSDGHYVGTVSRRNLLGIENKKIILVDHNEQSQAVDGINQAEILEIIDHHRIGTLQTLQPIYFINRPVGCTATILYQLFVDRGLEISKNTAGLLCAAIISDTLMFRSPTCSVHDKMAAGALALIAEVNIEDLASEMFEAGAESSGKTPAELFYQDYKKISFDNMTFGIGQISSMSEKNLIEIGEKIAPLLTKELSSGGVSMAFFMLTSIKDSSTTLLYAGKKADKLVLAAFPDAKAQKKSFVLDGVLSRKKQLVPAFMHAVTRI